LLFVTGLDDNALSIWRVNAEAGTLRQVEVYRDDDGDIDGLGGAYNVAVSGDLLFVTAINDNALSAWHINNAEVSFGVPLIIRAQSDMAVTGEVMVTVTACNGVECSGAEAVMLRDTVTLSPGIQSALARFPAPEPGRWIFTAQAEPSTLLDTRAARIAVQVMAPVRLTLAAPDRVTVGDTLTVTVGVDTGTPLTEGTSVTATLSFSAGGGDDRVVTLTSEMSSATERFTAPVTAGTVTVEVSGEVSGGTVVGASASVTVEPVAVVVELSAPAAVTVDETYQVMVVTNMPVPEGTTLE